MSVLACALTGALVGGCRRDAPEPAPQGLRSAAPSALPPATVPAGRIDRLPWREVPPEQAGLGLPQGCRAELPVRAAVVPASGVAFVSARSHASELAVAFGASDDPAQVERRGLVALEPRRRNPEVPWAEPPWTELLAPPLLDRSGTGWVGAWEQEAAAGRRRALLWRRGAAPELLAEGDALSVSDLACGDLYCALLTSRPLAAAAPGATLWVGRPEQPSSVWQRHDVPGEVGAASEPFSVLAVDGPKSVELTMLASGRLELWALKDGKAQRQGSVPAPHGALEVVPGTPPLVISPATPLGLECREDSFDLVLQAFGEEAFRIHTQAPPHGVLARRVQDGYLVAWLAPASCRVGGPMLVHAALVSAEGRPLGATMGVTTATGFALASSGDRVDLWLKRNTEIVWLRARCSAATPGAAGKAPREPAPP